MNLESNLFIYDELYGLVEINPEYQPKGLVETLIFKKNKTNESATFNYGGNTYTVFRTEKKTWVMNDNINKVLEFARRSNHCSNCLSFY